MNRTIGTKLLYLLIYGLAMGFMEAIIVIYLRQIYYPAGFNFPLAEISATILFAELIRELCTMVMLLSIAALAGKSLLQRFAYFLFSFAVWDIFYYAGLKLLINWPESFLTWDILFLIPVTWLGPVLAPVICSFLMILLSLIILYFDQNTIGFKLTTTEWTAMIFGSLLIFISFIRDFAGIIITNKFYADIFNLTENDKFREILTTFIPQNFSWEIFITGIVFILLSMLLIIRRFSKSIKAQ